MENNTSHSLPSSTPINIHAKYLQLLNLEKEQTIQKVTYAKYNNVVLKIFENFLLNTQFKQVALSFSKVLDSLFRKIADKIANNAVNNSTIRIVFRLSNSICFIANIEFSNFLFNVTINSIACEKRL
ncbi:MAG: hypothetical protein J6R37_01415 [Clostridia bacterium]|nr:hypothetical protein [Clostridia bacterium]